MLNPKAKVGLLVSVLGSSVASQAAAAEPVKASLSPKVTAATTKLSLATLTSAIAKLKYVLSGPVAN